MGRVIIKERGWGKTTLKINKRYDVINLLIERKKSTKTPAGLA